MQNVLLNREAGAVPIDKLSDETQVMLRNNSKHFFFFYCDNFVLLTVGFLV